LVVDGRINDYKAITFAPMQAFELDPITGESRPIQLTKKQKEKLERSFSEVFTSDFKPRALVEAARKGLLLGVPALV
jgi:hypothetical protein